MKGIIVIGNNRSMSAETYHQVFSKDYGFRQSIADQSTLADNWAKTLPPLEQLTLIDISGSPTPMGINSSLEATSSCSPSQLIVYPVSSGVHSVSMPADDTATLVKALSSGNEFPVTMITLGANILSEIKDLKANSANELLGLILARAVATNYQISEHENQLMVASTSNCSLSNASMAKMAREIINSSNIEEIFPNYNWETESNKSLANAYHALAALFIKLQDSDNALECLSAGDSFEESPRSLALKGLVSLTKGEILGAVANMVSSLQQYELVKKEGKTAEFSGQNFNLEIINSKLHAGLSALNKRNNEMALDNFAAAVFQFDPFFSQNGLDQIRVN